MESLSSLDSLDSSSLIEASWSTLSSPSKKLKLIGMVCLEEKQEFGVKLLKPLYLYDSITIIFHQTHEK